MNKIYRLGEDESKDCCSYDHRKSYFLSPQAGCNYAYCFECECIVYQSTLHALWRTSIIYDNLEELRKLVRRCLGDGPWRSEV